MSGCSSLPGRCPSRADRPIAQQRLHICSNKASTQKPVQAQAAQCKAATLERQVETEPDSVPEPRITREILAPPASGQLLDQGTAFCEEHRVRAYEVSPDQRATIVTIANLIQASSQLSSFGLAASMHICGLCCRNSTFRGYIIMQSTAYSETFDTRYQQSVGMVMDLRQRLPLVKSGK